jgi:hypothetical protein
MQHATAINCVKDLILLLHISISITMHTKFTASSGRAVVMFYRKLGEVSNITRRNSETMIINHGRTKFRSWKNMNKKKVLQSYTLSLVKYVTSEAQVHKHNCKEYEKKKMTKR